MIESFERRRQNVKIAFSRTILPRYEKVFDLMENFFIDKIEKSKNIDLKNKREVLQFWYELHLDFVKIHPFVDWNWRTARLIMNMWFLYSLNNLNIIYFKNRQKYIDSIENSDKNIENYYTFMNNNFIEFKSEELELLENKQIYKY